MSFNASNLEEQLDADQERPDEEQKKPEEVDAAVTNMRQQLEAIKMDEPQSEQHRQATSEHEAAEASGGAIEAAEAAATDGAAALPVSVYEKRFTMAKVTFGYVLRSSDKSWERLMSANPPKACVMTADRHLLLCGNQLIYLKRERQSNFYGHCNNDPLLDEFEVKLAEGAQRWQMAKDKWVKEGHTNLLEDLKARSKELGLDKLVFD